MRWMLMLLLLAWCGYGAVILNYNDIRLYGRKRLSQPAMVSGFRKALVMGAGRNYQYRVPNFSFNGRVEAAAMLWKNNPEIRLILSGYDDNMQYRESRDLMDALREKGVPDSVCILDTLSIDTYASILNYKQRFGDEKVLIISQDYHLERALWLACTSGMNAWGYVAPAITSDPRSHWAYRWFKNREYGARVKARLEVWGIIEDENEKNGL